MRDFLITSYEQMPVLLAFLLHIYTGYGYGMKRSDDISKHKHKNMTSHKSTEGQLLPPECMA